MKDEPGDKTLRLEQKLGLLALVLLLVGCVMVTLPFWSSLMWAGVLCFTLWPTQARVRTWLGDRQTLAALVMTASVALVLVVPFVVIGLRLADDARALSVAAKKWADHDQSRPPAWMEKIPLVGHRMAVYFGELQADTARLIQNLSEPPDEELDNLPATVPSTQPQEETKLSILFKQVTSSTRSWLIVAGLALVNGLAQVVLSVFLMFFVFRDGQVIGGRLNSAITRIGGERGRRLLELAGNTVRGVVYGIIGTGMAQGGVAGIGFAIAGVPGAALLGLLTFFLSVLPVGPPLVWIPATIWLFNTSGNAWGIFMLIWGFLCVSGLDNVLKPWLISQGAKMPFIVIFMGVLGGALAFGLIGVFLGPTLLAVAYRLVVDWLKPPAPLAANQPA